MSGTSLVPYQPKKKTDTRSAIDAFNEIIPPMDYSFCRIENIKDAEDEEPRPSPSPRGKHGKTPRPEEGSKTKSKCLKMNNNSITNLESLLEFAKVKFTRWEDIAWIDLSHNELTTIGPEFTEFQGLQILYLHGNQIADPGLIDQLVPIRTLRKLTLHGNPMENVKGYRWLVLSKLPQLQSLDFSCITKADRMTTGTWDKMNCWGMKKKKKVEEDED
ncbi:LRC51-like protein [Mya arenaria]|uniref:LRC51-like protein n=1 Tax=Mya arenaria TaxID=6604 RepID=A0ABY7DRU9_MYAAR|nr:leucine-rich repeat-containing protein 51-like [Mya arenaria]WAQ99405.1 LRC51-like protein [Mya arenaria]